MACIHAAWSSKVAGFFVVIGLFYCSYCQPVKSEPDTDEILLEIFEGPMRSKNVFLIANEDLLQSTNMEEILLKRNEEGKGSTMLSSLEKLPETLDLMPVQYIRGTRLIVVMVFQFMPQYILDPLVDNVHWNPDYFLLISLNMSLDTSQILQNEAIRRSFYIALVEKSKSGSSDVRFVVYTSIPFQSGKRDYGKKTFLGLWNKKTFATPKQLFPERFESYGGVTMYLSSWCDDIPFLYYQTNSTVCEGVNLDLLDIISEKFNFSYDVQWLPQDMKWGTIENGSWTGLPAGLLYFGKDIMVNNYQITEDSARDLDATYPFHFEGFGLILAKPQREPLWRGLYYPFTFSAWMAIIGLLVTVTIIFYIVFSLVVQQRNREAAELSNVFLVVFGGFLQQPSVFENLRERWATGWIGFWDLLGLIFTTAYTGNLIAFLTTPYYPPRIETIYDLGASTIRVVMMDYGSIVLPTLKISEVPSLRALSTRFDFITYTYYNFTEGFDLSLKGTHATTEMYSYLWFMALFHNVLDRLYMMDKQLIPWYNTWFFPKNSPHSKPVDRILQRLVETGQKIKSYELRMAPVQKQNILSSIKVESVRPLTMEHFVGPFFILAIGFALSFLTLLAEILVARKKAWNLKK